VAASKLGLLAQPARLAQVECVRLASGAFRRVRDSAGWSLLDPAALARRLDAAPVREARRHRLPLYGRRRRHGRSFIRASSRASAAGRRAGTASSSESRRLLPVSGASSPVAARTARSPGMLLRDGVLLGPFGVMGGFIQAQAHVQLVSALVDEGLDPQAALDRPRFRVDGGDVLLEEGLWERTGEVEALGLRPVPSEDHRLFGGGQAILRRPEGGWIGGSDRKAGRAAGFWALRPG
jgi:hypothetical protein